MFKLKNKTIRIKRSDYEKAFTLIELMVVMAIISLLSAVVLSSLANARMKANDTKISQDLRQFRIAAELYYNDNHVYPAGYAFNNNQNESIAVNNFTEGFWGSKLAFFTKKADAAGTLSPTHNTTLLCKNFDTMAIAMVNNKYLSVVPVHPYDNDATGVCYKAINNNSTFASYAVLTTQVAVSGGVVNKRTGFILGDTSSSGLINLASSTIAIAPSGEIPYPSDNTGVVAANINTSVDGVDGITSGAPAASSGFSGIISAITGGSSAPTGCPSGQAVNPLGACQALFTGIRITCIAPAVEDPFSFGCIGGVSGGLGLGLGLGGLGAAASSSSSGPQCSYGSVLQLNGVCVLPAGGSCTPPGVQGPCPPPGYSSCPVGKTFLINGLENTANGTCQ